MNAIATTPEMTAAVDRVLAALGLERKTFADRRDSAILDELATDFELSESSALAAVVLAQAAEVARELEGYVRKVCGRCDREFWVVSYLAHRPAYKKCGRADCVQTPIRSRQRRTARRELSAQLSFTATRSSSKGAGGSGWPTLRRMSW